MTINLADRTNVHEYLYPLANPQQTKVGGVGDHRAELHPFLIDERDGSARARRQQEDLRRRHHQGHRYRPALDGAGHVLSGRRAAAC